MFFRRMLSLAALVMITFTIACSESPTTEPTSPPPASTETPRAAPTETATARVTATAFINAATALAGTRPPHTPVTPSRTPQPTQTRAPNAIPAIAQGGKPEPTVLNNAKRIPDTHAGRTQCLTCHEFGNVGPPMPQFHKDDKYTDNSFCERCHKRP